MASSSTDQADAATIDSVAEEVRKIRSYAVRLEVLLQPVLSGNSAIGASFEELKGSIKRVAGFFDCKETGTGVGSLFSGEQTNGEVSSQKRKINLAGDRRGGSRRRARSSSVKIVNSKTLEDGQTWRKYGQKQIQCSEHPRSYFRCTHKNDQGCLAQRQVQRLENDPSTYVITYMGEHTCRDPAIVSHMLSSSGFKETCIISFGSNMSCVKQEAALPASLAPPKQESDEEAVSNLTTTSSSSEYIQLPAPQTMTTAAGNVSDHGDVTSGFQSCDDLVDLDFIGDQYLDHVLDFANEYL